MLEDILKNNPAFSGMDPQKLQFITSFANMEKPRNMNQAIPFLLAQMNLAKKNNLNFSRPEVQLLCEILSKDLPKEEQERVKKMMQIFNNHSGN